jgi:hypothetical protein
MKDIVTWTDFERVTQVLKAFKDGVKRKIEIKGRCLHLSSAML